LGTGLRLAVSGRVWNRILRESFSIWVIVLWSLRRLAMAVCREWNCSALRATVIVFRATFRVHYSRRNASVRSAVFFFTPHFIFSSSM
jgi:hypothetical protein